MKKKITETNYIYMQQIKLLNPALIQHHMKRYLFSHYQDNPHRTIHQRTTLH